MEGKPSIKSKGRQKKVVLRDCSLGEPVPQKQRYNRFLDKLTPQEAIAIAIRKQLHEEWFGPRSLTMKTRVGARPGQRFIG